MDIFVLGALTGEVVVAIFTEFLFFPYKYTVRK